MAEASCAICGSQEKLVRDHDHKTGEIRGWLCARCNVMLGYAADSQDRLKDAAAYLATTTRQPRSKRGEPTPARRDRAAYMREYRARKRTGEGQALDGLADRYGARVVQSVALNARIAELEAEVTRLKREIAEREHVARTTAGTFNSRPFTPVPKHGK